MRRVDKMLVSPIAWMLVLFLCLNFYAMRLAFFGVQTEAIITRSSEWRYRRGCQVNFEFQLNQQSLKGFAKFLPRACPKENQKIWIYYDPLFPQWNRVTPKLGIDRASLLVLNGLSIVLFGWFILRRTQ